VTKLILRFEHSHQALGFQREWNMIAIVLISVCTVNKCNPFSINCISGVVFSRSVVSLEVVKINTLSVFCQRECVS